jgi:hypothetical protein
MPSHHRQTPPEERGIKRMTGGFAGISHSVGWMANVIDLRDLKGPLQSEFDGRPLNIRPRLVLGPPEHGTKRMAGTLGLTLEPGGMARFQADLVIPQWLANQVYGLLEALSRADKCR